MSKSGRNAKGQFIRDDELIRDALGWLADAVSIVAGFMASPAMDAATREAQAEKAQTFVAAVREALPMIDVGTKPGKEPINESSS